MYSILPAVVASIFVAYGLFVVGTKGFTRIGTSFFALCITSAVWQGTWAVLFEVRDPQVALFLVKLGYLLILFLPTSLYHFLAEISECSGERYWVYRSYGLATIFAVLLIGTDLFVDGYHTFFWGYYPKAGLLHPLHVLQTVVVVSRGLYITYRQQQLALPGQNIKLRLCIGAVFTYFFASIDYLCNYGIEFYPPGVVFIALSLGIMTIAIVKYNLLTPMAIATTVAHEMRTPLASIRMLASGMDRFLPTLLEGYRLSVEHDLLKASIKPLAIRQLSRLGASIAQEVDRTTTVLDMMLASVRMNQLDTSSFRRHAIGSCISEALDRYSFQPDERERVSHSVVADFEFYGSDSLLVLVFFNLLKNSLYALKVASKGEIHISTACAPTFNSVSLTDTGIGVARDELPRIFAPFYTTKKSGGSGIGLAFCQRVMTAFGGSIRCESVAGEYTTFTLEFPVVERAADPRLKRSTIRHTKEKPIVFPSSGV